MARQTYQLPEFWFILFFLFHYTSEVCLNGTSTKGRTPGTFGGAGISSLITVGFSFVFVRNTTTASVINWKTNVKSNKNPRMPIEIIHINFGSGGVTNSAGKFRSWWTPLYIKIMIERYGKIVLKNKSNFLTKNRLGKFDGSITVCVVWTFDRTF